MSSGYPWLIYICLQLCHSLGGNWIVTCIINWVGICKIRLNGYERIYISQNYFMHTSCVRKLRRGGPACSIICPRLLRIHWHSLLKFKHHAFVFVKLLGNGVVYLRRAVFLLSNCVFCYLTHSLYQWVKNHDYMASEHESLNNGTQPALSLTFEKLLHSHWVSRMISLMNNEYD